MAEIIAVSALNKYVRSVLESDAALADIAIRGEISNFSRNFKTGHCYFSLKDEKASVRAVLFRSHADQLAFAPGNGMCVVARGRITLYERDGSFQINVEFLFLDGAGSAQAAFEQLKEKLRQEGLFAPQAKKPLPSWPKRIGLVTSQTGAALQDICRVAQRRCPLVHFVLAPVAVQGESAPPQIVRAIRALDASDEIDLIIVARGGGSAEDLQAFNDEALARAAFVCRTPLVSAIGHEIDFTILDFVADVRAPTPSAAAEMALPDIEETKRRMLQLGMNMAGNIQFSLESCYNRLRRSLADPALQKPRQNLAGRTKQMWRSLSAAQSHARQGARAVERRLQAAALLAHGLSPYAVLARGYAMARQNGRALRSVSAVRREQPVEIVLRDGQLHCAVQKIVPQREEPVR